VYVLESSERDYLQLKAAIMTLSKMNIYEEFMHVKGEA